MCYTDGSHKETDGYIRNYLNDIKLSPIASARIVYKYPDGLWRAKPIIIIHISQGHRLERDYVYPMALLAMICALGMARLVHHPHQTVVSDSQSSIDHHTVKPPVLGESHHHFRTELLLKCIHHAR
jgi:hypothetical protein